MAKNSSQVSASSRTATRSAAKLRLFACKTCNSSTTSFTSKLEMDKHSKMFHPRVFVAKLRPSSCDTGRTSSTLFISKLELEKHSKMFHPHLFANKEENSKIKRKRANQLTESWQRKKQQQPKQPQHTKMDVSATKAGCIKRGRNTEKVNRRLEKKVEMLSRFSTRRSTSAAEKKLHRVVKSADTRSQLGGSLLRIVLTRLDASAINQTAIRSASPATPTATLSASPATPTATCSARPATRLASPATPIATQSANPATPTATCSASPATPITTRSVSPTKKQSLKYCNGCNKSFTRLYGHLTNNEQCSQQYDMVKMQQGWKAEKREKRRLLQQKIRSEKMEQDPNAFRDKRRLEKQKWRFMQMEKDPNAFRDKNAAEKQRERQRKADSDSFREKRQLSTQMWRLKQMEKDSDAVRNAYEEAKKTEKIDADTDRSDQIKANLNALREKARLRKQKSRLRQMEKDPDAFRDKINAYESRKRKEARRMQKMKADADAFRDIRPTEKQAERKQEMGKDEEEKGSKQSERRMQETEEDSVARQIGASETTAREIENVISVEATEEEEKSIGTRSNRISSSSPLPPPPPPAFNKKSTKCGSCPPCLVKENCNQCENCKYRKIRKQSCTKRKCLNLRKKSVAVSNKQRYHHLRKKSVAVSSERKESACVTTSSARPRRRNTDTAKPATGAAKANVDNAKLTVGTIGHMNRRHRGNGDKNRSREIWEKEDHPIAL